MGSQPTGLKPDFQIVVVGLIEEGRVKKFKRFDRTEDGVE